MTTASGGLGTDRRRLIAFALVGAAVAVLLGVYGSVHDPTREQPYTLFFTGTINLKVWFATLSVVFAVIQVLTALRIYGRISVPRDLPLWLGDFHRLTGTLAFGFSLPVAYHCLWALGFETGTGWRVIVHAVAGCFFYGAFATKVLSVRSRGLPSIVLPVVGGAVFTSLVVLWLTSSVWWWSEFEFPGF